MSDLSTLSPNSVMVNTHVSTADLHHTKISTQKILIFTIIYSPKMLCIKSPYEAAHENKI